MAKGARMIDQDGRRVLAASGAMLLSNSADDGADCCCEKYIPADGCDAGFVGPVRGGSYPAGLCALYSIAAADSGKIFTVDGIKRRLTAGGACTLPLPEGATVTPLTPDSPQPTCAYCFKFLQANDPDAAIKRGMLVPGVTLLNPGEIVHLLCPWFYDSAPPTYPDWDGKMPVYSIEHFAPVYNRGGGNLSTGGSAFTGLNQYKWPGFPHFVVTNANVDLHLDPIAPYWAFTLELNFNPTIDFILLEYRAPFDPENPTAFPAELDLHSATGLFTDTTGSGSDATFAVTAGPKAKLRWDWFCEGTADFTGSFEGDCPPRTPPPEPPPASSVPASSTPGSSTTVTSSEPESSTPASSTPASSTPASSTWDSYKIRTCNGHVILDGVSVLAFDPITHAGTGMQTKVIWYAPDDDPDAGECYEVTNIQTTGGILWTADKYETCTQCLANHQWIQITECSSNALVDIWMLVKDWQSSPINSTKSFKLSGVGCFRIDAGSPRVTVMPALVATPVSVGSDVFDDCIACDCCVIPGKSNSYSMNGSKISGFKYSRIVTPYTRALDGTITYSAGSGFRLGTGGICEDPHATGCPRYAIDSTPWEETSDGGATWTAGGPNQRTADITFRYDHDRPGGGWAVTVNESLGGSVIDTDPWTADPTTNVPPLYCGPEGAVTKTETVVEDVEPELDEEGNPTGLYVEFGSTIVTSFEGTLDNAECDCAGEDGPP